MLTEDEAKTKWCPHAIASHTDPRQRIQDGWLHHCIASECMAWRWVDPTNPDPEDIAEWGGYCGLAGEP